MELTYNSQKGNNIMAKTKKTKRRGVHVQAWFDPQNEMDSHVLEVIEKRAREAGSIKKLMSAALLLYNDTDTRHMYLSSDAMLNELYQMSHHLMTQMKTMQETIANLTSGDWTSEQRHEIGQRSMVQFDEMEKSIGAMFKPMRFESVDED